MLGLVTSGPAVHLAAITLVRPDRRCTPIDLALSKLSATSCCGSPGLEQSCGKVLPCTTICGLGDRGGWCGPNRPAACTRRPRQAHIPRLVAFLGVRTALHHRIRGMRLPPTGGKRRLCRRSASGAPRPGLRPGERRHAGKPGPVDRPRRRGRVVEAVTSATSIAVSGGLGAALAAALAMMWHRASRRVDG